MLHEKSLFFDFSIFLFLLPTRAVIWVFSHNIEDFQFCPLSELISTLTVRPIFCHNSHLVKRVETEKGKLWPRIQSLPWMKLDVISYLTPQCIRGRINRQDMAWKTAHWKANTSTWERRRWILHYAAEILF